MGDLRAKIAEAIEGPIRDCLSDHDSFDRNDNLRNACAEAALAAVVQWLGDRSAALSEVAYADEPIAHTIRLIKAEAVSDLAARALTERRRARVTDLGDALQLDIATAVARVEQALALPDGDALRWHLLDRLLTCDAPRLRGHLSPEWVARLDGELK